jgi:hypothetical protein
MSQPRATPAAGEEFLVRFGDAIDDRIAEIFDDLLEEHEAARRRLQLPLMLAMVSLALAAFAAGFLLH